MKDSFKNLYIYIFLVSEYLIYTLTYSSMPVKPEDFAGMQSLKIVITILITLTLVLEGLCYDDINGDIKLWDLPIRIKTFVIGFIVFSSFLIMWETGKVLLKETLRIVDLKYCVYMLLGICQLLGIGLMLYEKKKYRKFFLISGFLFCIGAGVAFSEVYRFTDLYRQFLILVESNPLILKIVSVLVSVFLWLPLFGVSWYSESKLLDTQDCEALLLEIEHSKEPVKLTDDFCRFVKFSLIKRKLFLFVGMLLILPGTSLVMYSIGKINYFFNFWKSVINIDYSDMIILMYSISVFSIVIFSLFASVTATNKLRKILDRNYD